MTEKLSDYSLHFLGTGSGGELSMGCSAAVLEYNTHPQPADGPDTGYKPLLLIDCGPGTVNAFSQHYQQLPDALFITHGHLDHIADLEILTVRLRLSGKAPVPMYVPVNIIPLLHQRLASYPGTMAEGDHNFWQSFQLIPVSERFTFHGLECQLYPTRHHAPGFSYALHVPGLFFYSGDTRPIPEIIHHQLTGQEAIFHDCGAVPNPSHTGLADLAREYRAELLPRFVLYHYANEAAAQSMENEGYKVARPGERFAL
ncbi:MAG: MBL fold metallo-hydrolase [Oceanospirillaceae bacterium]|uniref:MBL fold metallo-hydrolase n=1 Tax=unclassified Thalassolituus TaxID=2624967 RepID=UPI000C63E53E|nr:MULTISPECIES: MBL fold metallo-hydrolase [unclassified Thalassolituus]MAS26109.1 MBL fold metallo-hydrolase [Oceanospirillaceae bacterium]MBS54587.1 MBL fold metallo-hydrolase [Oceanospirillaceae bacterium]|tara:strand:- start:908 stop:1678 length:771 start_codon:yes stop_codon:yes gene_type:complete